MKIILFIFFRIEPVVATKLVGLILARGGSKGLARKNLATINNKTLLSRALTAMANSNCNFLCVSLDLNLEFLIRKEYIDWLAVMTHLNIFYSD